MATCSGSVGKVGLTILLLVASIGPVIAMIWFAWWFLRAGKRYDERERAARSNSTQDRP
ncbi:MAG TPA: hypothetical protein VHQ99_00680 [Gaiellaceae bacterium]|jgi:hypothetical protein|nr:hypothetical protein [Gaiellaceae bacterium]